jgi:hypothetical protein
MDFGALKMSSILQSPMGEKEDGGTIIEVEEEEEYKGVKHGKTLSHIVDINQMPVVSSIETSN